LNAAETQVYDSAVRFWRHLQRALKDVEAILPSSAAPKRASNNGTVAAEAEETDPDGSGKSGKDAWKAFWSTQQRFFKLLCVSMKVNVMFGGLGKLWLIKVPKIGTSLLWPLPHVHTSCPHLISFSYFPLRD
jgi:hypothetical protein